jgi:hypothetical protein
MIAAWYFTKASDFRLPERSRSEHLGPWLDSSTRNSGVIRGVSADTVSAGIP